MLLAYKDKDAEYSGEVTQNLAKQLKLALVNLPAQPAGQSKRVGLSCSAMQLSLECLQEVLLDCAL